MPDVSPRDIAQTILRNPVGTSTLRPPQELTMPSANVSPVVDQRLTPFASRPLSQAEYDEMQKGAKDYSTDTFAQLALAGIPPEAPTFAAPRMPVRAIKQAAPAAAIAPAAAGRTAGEDVRAIIENSPFGVPAGVAGPGGPGADTSPVWLAKQLAAATQ